MSEIFKKVKNITADFLKINPGEIVRESNFIDDLAADSIDTIELFMVLEEEYEIKIPDEDARELTTVDNVVTYIENKISSGRS